MAAELLKITYLKPITGKCKAYLLCPNLHMCVQGDEIHGSGTGPKGNFQDKFQVMGFK